MLVAPLLVACAGTRPQVVAPIAPPHVVVMEPMKIEVEKTPAGTRVTANDAAGLFEQAGADLEAQRFVDAAAGYQHLVTSFPDSRYVVASLYNGGLALEGAKDFAGAAARYRELVDHHGETRDALDALFRMGACYAELTNWAASADAFAQVLTHKDLGVGDYVEAAARRGLAQYNMKDAHAAERSFRDGLGFYHRNETVERLDSDFFVAMSAFYLGEIAHDDFRLMPLRLPQAQLKKDLDAKAEMLLLTQSRYVDTARVKNPAWATAAGYQMATLYKEFYDAMIGAPLPPEIKDDETKQVYFEELRKQIEPLLRKAVHAHELTQGVAERFGIDNEWVRKSNEQMAQLRVLLNPGEKAATPEPLGDRVVPPAPTRPARPENDKMLQPSQPPEVSPNPYHPRVVL
jgi:tetratricopeptide (TPR) repeat protein